MQSIFFLTLFLFLASLLPSAAQSQIENILKFATPRQQLWTFLRDRPAGGSRFAFTRADQLALNPDRVIWPYLIRASASASPLLQYDRNVNGGFPNNVITILDVPFILDDESTAQEALTAGVSISSNLGFAVAQGATLSLIGRADYQRAIGADYEVSRKIFSAVLGYTMQNWAYTDVSLGIEESKRELSEDTGSTGSLTFGKIFGSNNRNVHDLSITYTRTEIQSVWQSRVRLNWTVALLKGGVLKFGVEKGTAESGALVTVTGASASYSNILLGAPTTFSATYSDKSGGQIFGLPRHDFFYRIRAEREINPKLSIYVSFDVTDSNLDGFDDKGFDVGFNFVGLRF